MIVTPEEVKKSFDEKTKNWKTVKSTLKINNDVRAFEKGREEGKTLANSRSIEG